MMVRPNSLTRSSIPQSPPMPSAKRRSWPMIPLVIGLFGLNLISPAIAQEKIMQRTLSVSGRGVESIATSFARINLGVEVQGKTASQVQAEVARKSTSLVSLLKSRGVEKLQTTGINLSPNYDYTDNRQVLKGYIGTNTVSFRVKNEAAGELIDDAVKSGATRIDGISFTASDDAIADAQKVALRKATEDAQAQAKAVLGALGFQAKEIVGIQVNGAPPPPQVLLQRMDAKESAQVARTPVEGGEQQVEGSVTLQISY
jgi:uncharacterized protein